MGWLLLGAVAVGAWLLSGRPRFKVYEGEGGTWAFALYRRGQLISTETGFASQADATAAALQAVEFLENPFAQPQGAPVPPPVAPPIPPPPAPPALPYLVVRSPPVSGEARATTTGVRWTMTSPDGVQTDTTANAVSANATLLARVNGRAPLNAAVRIELRKANGTTLVSQVSEVVDGWRWTLDTPPTQPGGVGTSVSQPTWVAPNRPAAMRNALVQLQEA